MSNSMITEGDIVKVKRTKPVPYCHYGIYIGNGELIHLSGAEFNLAAKSGANVHRVTWKEFIGDSVEFGYIPCPPGVSRAEVVRRAKSAEGGFFRNREYDLFTNNCEHFARWCHGEASSEEVQKLVFWAAVGSAVVVIGGIVIALFFGTNTPRRERRR